MSETQSLMHGTCGCCAERIKQTGFRANSYFTDCEDIAAYYAEEAMDDCEQGCGEYTLIHVTLPTAHLQADFNSYAEPLSYFRNAYTASDNDWFDMIDTGDVPYPMSAADFATSLAVVRSVKHPQVLAADIIQHIET